MLRIGGLSTEASLSTTTNAPTFLWARLRAPSISSVVNSFQRLPNRRSSGSGSPTNYHHQKASKATFCVFKMLHGSFPIMGKEDFQFLLSTYIRPILEYGSQIAHTGLIRDRDCLERVQRRGTKLIKGFFDLPYSARLAELNLYPLESRRIHGDRMLLFHVFQTGDVHYFFTLTTQKHLRGHDKKLILPHGRNRIRHNIFTLRVISTWNALPEEIVHSPSKTNFKRLRDSYLGLKT